ncbi:MAG: LysR family transcriptional regulator [Burkholderiales bacterium]
MKPSAPPASLPLLLRLRTRQLALLGLLDTERHLGRAAAQLSISQPAASKLLSQMESTFGVPLFERHARGMSPTAQGDVLIRYARRMLADFASVRDELTALQVGLRGALRIGSVAGAVPGLLAPLLCDYRRQHPLVAVSVVVGTSDRMLGQLVRGEVDLVLGRPVASMTDSDWSSLPLLEEALVVVARGGHPLAERTNLTFNDLLGAGWVLQPPGTPQRTRFDAFLREAGLHARLNIVETASNIATTALLEVSDMLSIMPGSLADHYGRLGLLRRLSLRLPVHVPPVHLIAASDANLSPPARRFVEQVRAQRELEPPMSDPAPTASGQAVSTPTTRRAGRKI